MMHERARTRDSASTTIEAVGQVIARPAVELHPFAGLARDNLKAVVLNLVQPNLAARRLWG
jgi:hypothetical protein